MVATGGSRSPPRARWRALTEMSGHSATTAAASTTPRIPRPSAALSSESPCWRASASECGTDEMRSVLRG